MWFLAIDGNIIFSDKAVLENGKKTNIMKKIYEVPDGYVAG